MTFWRAFLHHHRFAAALLLAAVLALRVAVPGGWMVEQQGGELTVALCSDASGGQVFVTIPLGDDTPDPHEGKQAPCAFTALAGLADLPHAADLPMPLSDRVAPARMPLEISVGRGLAAPPPPQTGPPAIA
ncbi:hypothetical protein [Novosphingobium sp.]|uniref:hypothetical protein n=1 Tax=Novosphingobium sp. TaxID=1874826 RepID=UPI002732F002|nr:hypothetical protein [Novosphingobium sp.]MDP3907031.1 hypothetical protein [Novosphingobium sp.]